jgi:hypothetical protein
MSVGRKAAVAAMMAMYGPTTRANMRVLFSDRREDLIALPPLQIVIRQDDDRVVLEMWYPVGISDHLNADMRQGPKSRQPRAIRHHVSEMCLLPGRNLVR